MTNIDEHTLWKIRKLYELADKATFQGESDNARARADEMCKRYNIAMTTVKYDEKSISRKRWDKYLIILINAVGTSCGVQIVERTHYNTSEIEQIMVGKPFNIMVMQELLIYLWQWVDRQADEHRAEYKREFGKAPSMAYMNDYKNGLAMGVRNILEAQQDVWADGLAEQREVREEKFGFLRVQKKVVRASEANRAGYAQGRTVNLARQASSSVGGRVAIGGY